MPHYTEGELQAYLDQEVSAPARETIAAHLDTCPVCGDSLAALRSAAGLFASAVGLADVPAPKLSPAGLRARRRAEAAWGLAGFSRRALARAAILIVTAAAAASAAVPGSPVRRIIENAWQQITAETALPEAPATPPEAPATPPAVEPTQIPGFAAIEPVEGRALVRLINAAPGVKVRVVVVDSPKVMVTAYGAASNAQFGTATGRLDVTGAGPGEIVIQLPRTANATVQVNGRPYVEKAGEQLRFPGPAPDQRGDQILFQTQ